MATTEEPVHIRVTYNDVHNLIRAAAAKTAEFKPDMLIAIGASPFKVAICSSSINQGRPSQVEGEYASDPLLASLRSF